MGAVGQRIYGIFSMVAHQLQIGLPADSTQAIDPDKLISEECSMSEDEEHLRLLSIFHYIVGGLAGLCACFPVIHLAVGIMMLVAPHTLDGPRPEGEEMDRMMGTVAGVLFTVIPLLLILLGWSFAICLIVAGKFLAAHTHYTFCLVMAAISCIFMPLGTVLGVFTIVVLMRPSVKELFEVRGSGGKP